MITLLIWVLAIGYWYIWIPALVALLLIWCALTGWK